MRRPPALAALALALACSRGGDSEAKRRVFSRDDAPRAERAFDFEHPAAALALGAGGIARQLGPFEWTAVVEWTMSREGDDAERVRAVERHKIRQSATGEFEVVADLDPGLGPGSVTGKEIVFAGGMTYARAKYAPFRERPTDHGRDARRFRDDSFGLAAAVARLYGSALLVTPAGESTVLGRKARRYQLALARGAAPPAPSVRPAGLPPPDEDTRRRLRFLDGRIPTSAEGELLLDDATGAPLRVRLAGAFAVKDEPSVRATVELLAQVRALGGEVAAIVPPKALPDERKAAGVAAALDAAGLRKRSEEGKAGGAEPADEPGE